MRRVRRFLELTGSQRRRLARVAARLVWVRGVVAVRGIAPYRERWEWHESCNRTTLSADDSDDVREHAWAIEVAQRYLPGTGACLQGAIVLCEFLEQRGLTPTLRIGSRKTSEGCLTAHAWVEVAGDVVLGGREAPREYVAFASAH